MDPTADGKKVPDQTNEPALTDQNIEPEKSSSAEQPAVAQSGQEGGLIEVEHTNSDTTGDVPGSPSVSDSSAQSSPPELSPVETPLPSDVLPATEQIQTEPIQPELAQAQSSPVVQPTVISPDSGVQLNPPIGEQPVVGQPYVGGSVVDATSQVPITAPKLSKKPKKLFLAAAVVAVVIILGLGYTFALYLPNTPGNVYNAGLKNSGLAVDKLVNIFSQQTSSITGMAYDGSMNVKSSTASFDASLKGAIDKDGNSNNHIDADIVGQKIGLDLLSVHVSGNTTNDLYFKVSGASNLLDSMGVSSLDSLDGQWISVDHTLIDTYLNNLSSSAGAGSLGTTIKPPTTADIEDTFTKVQAVNKQYLFTGNSQTAVFVNKKFVGTETKDGQKQNHYQVGYNKDNLASYLDAVGKALDSSKLNSWVKNTGGSTNISDAMGFKDMEDKIKQLNSDASFDMWVNTKTKLIGDIQFTDTADGSKLTIAQAYNGGSVYPFSISITDSPDVNGSINFTIDSKSNKYALAFSMNPGKTSGGDTTIQGKLNFSPNNQPVKVTAPANATPITDILSQGLSGAGSFASNPLLERIKLNNI